MTEKERKKPLTEKQKRLLELKIEIAKAQCNNIKAEGEATLAEYSKPRNPLHYYPNGKPKSMLLKNIKARQRANRKKLIEKARKIQQTQEKTRNAKKS